MSLINKPLYINPKTILLLIIALVLNFYKLNAQEISVQDSTKRSRIKMTSLAFGGTGVLISNVNGKSTIMTGGRGSATFNNCYTFGGAGWGMPNGVEIESSNTDTFEFFKFGYGGLEFGYIFYAGEKFSFGSNLLVACGVGFKETVPKSTDGDFNIFPVFEPSLYSQISLGKLVHLDIGITYRFVTGANFSYISNQKISGPSFYIAFLLGSCSCN
ncbi:MAG: hypothetical protein A2W99_14225 [Bacteroidetes bacterium GWF2_33_16]|nr:MAG: hypothetical protein A2X00_06155 [Bacteroidetes bacterium GWE2_32_14]OFY04782.1 MAG: hypothetical protein A2W99_14225 [Bacteroidetes bacterium GWF2_33_16]